MAEKLGLEDREEKMRKSNATKWTLGTVCYIYSLNLMCEEAWKMLS